MIYPGVDGVSKQMDKGWFGVDGVWRVVDKIFMGVDGAWREAFSDMIWYLIASREDGRSATSHQQWFDKIDPDTGNILGSIRALTNSPENFITIGGLSSLGTFEGDGGSTTQGNHTYDALNLIDLGKTGLNPTLGYWWRIQNTADGCFWRVTTGNPAKLEKVRYSDGVIVQSVSITTSSGGYMAITLSPDSNYFYVIWYTSTNYYVYRYPITGGAYDKYFYIGNFGSGYQPTRLYFGPDGYLYVIRYDHVWKLNPDLTKVADYTVGYGFSADTAWHAKFQNGVMYWNEYGDSGGQYTYFTGIRLSDGAVISRVATFTNYEDRPITGRPFGFDGTYLYYGNETWYSYGGFFRKKHATTGANIWTVYLPVEYRYDGVIWRSFQSPQLEYQI